MKVFTFAISILLTAFAPTVGAQPVTKITGGYGHSLFLKSDGSLWAMGYNAFGQLGDGTFNNTNKPEQIVASNVTAIAAAYYFSLFIKSDGSLWAMGTNNFGQLGDGTFNTTNRPEQIVASNVTAIATAGQFSLFLKKDGSLWGMGYNAEGELGDGTTNNVNHPQQIVSSNVTAIAAGYAHSLFLKSDSSLWAMGANNYGQLGDGTTNNVNHPEQIVASNVTAIAAGGAHSLFLKSDGSLWTFGANVNGQLGDGTFKSTNQPKMIVASNVVTIAAGGGSAHDLFVKNDGSLWTVGFNFYGQMGDGTFTTASPLGKNVPEQIVASNITAIAAGYAHSLFIRSDGSLWTMGYNYYGQLGDGTYTTIIPPYGKNIPEQIVALPAKPAIWTQPTNQVVSVGASVSLGVFATGTNPISYYWKFNGTNLVNATNALYNIASVTTNQAGIYSVAVTNVAGGVISSNAVLTVTVPAGYNQISGQILNLGNMQFSYVGVAGWKYALDRSFSLSPANWIPQVTNPADANGNLVFTNAPNSTTNNFWRIRSVP